MNPIKNKRGQGVLEMLLLVVLFLGVAFTVTTGLRKMQIVGKMVEGPWDIMRGMITNGVWGTPDKTKPLHPNYIRRHISFEAQEVR